MNPTSITLFSPPRASGKPDSPEQIRDTVLRLAQEDEIEGLGSAQLTDSEVTFGLAEGLEDDVLAWLDDVALAEGYGMRTDKEVLRFGDEDVEFMYQLRGDDDLRLGASRAGLEPIVESMSEDEDFIKISRFNLDDPGDESTYIKATNLASLNGFTIEVSPPRRTTILADTTQTVQTMQRWMDGEALSELAWSE
ncbi:hypothetical protein ACXZ66_03760 [Corynebacterium sp. S7]